MRSRKKLTQFLVLFLVAIFVISSFSLVSLSSYTKAKGNIKEAANAKVNSNTDTKAIAVNVEQDKKLTDDVNKKLGDIFKDEKAVISLQANVRGSEVIATIAIIDGVNMDDINKLTKSYADKLKGEFKDKKITVQAWQSGVNKANFNM